MNRKFITALLAVLVAVGIGAFALVQAEPRFSFPVLLIADVLMFLLSAVAFMMVHKTFNERPQAFVRGVLSGMMVKMFACVIGIVLYAVLNKSHLYKPQVFVMLGIYAIYSIVETTLLSRMAKGAK